jgi:hypothetical protein
MVLVAGTTTATLARVARLSWLGVRVWMDMGLSCSLGVAAQVIALARAMLLIMDDISR